MLTPEFKNLVVKAMSISDDTTTSDSLRKKMVVMRDYILFENEASDREEYYRNTFAKADSLGLKDEHYLLALMNALMVDEDDDEGNDGAEDGDL